MGVFTQEAVKERLKARIAIDGPTGSGKTWTALQCAAVLTELTGAPIGLLDTENRSAAYYAPTPGQDYTRLHPWDPPYKFFHLPQRPPYDPRELGAIIDAAHEDLGEDGVMIIDSLTHYWTGEGGTLDIVDNAASRGNSFTGWKEGTPAQRFMLDKIIHAPFHVIVTMRSKMEYVLETDGKGKQVPRKIGMAPEQRAGVEYEFTVVADMDLEHRMVISKSRCDPIADLVLPKGRSAETFITFRDWLGTGVQRVSEGQVRELVNMFAAIGGKEARIKAKQEFVDRFGPAAELLEDRWVEARVWVAAAAGLTLDDAPPPVLHGALADALAEPDTLPLDEDQEPADDTELNDTPPVDELAEARAAAEAAGGTWPDDD